MAQEVGIRLFCLQLRKQQTVDWTEGSSRRLRCLLSWSPLCSQCMTADSVSPWVTFPASITFMLPSESPTKHIFELGSKCMQVGFFWTTSNSALESTTDHDSLLIDATHLELPVIRNRVGQLLVLVDDQGLDTV